eukprot:TRINITY_DN32427_c0_g1_i1.p1 TRINITY_DN32427_c0_g1~~TRINITY_DN32427_c0_g1_i1.p1  ORF type:complete len:791 (+),score=49.68 TRINITY_DN32427_c0_g1_i1:31-2403(+)
MSSNGNEVILNISNNNDADEGRDDDGAAADQITGTKTSLGSLADAALSGDELAAALVGPLSLALKANVHELADLLLQGLKMEVRDILSVTACRHPNPKPTSERIAPRREVRAHSLGRPMSLAPRRLLRASTETGMSPMIDVRMTLSEQTDSFDSMAGVPQEENASEASRSFENQEKGCRSFDSQEKGGKSSGNRETVGSPNAVSFAQVATCPELCELSSTPLTAALPPLRQSAPIVNELPSVPSEREPEPKSTIGSEQVCVMSQASTIDIGNQTLTCPSLPSYTSSTAVKKDTAPAKVGVAANPGKRLTIPKLSSKSRKNASELCLLGDLEQSLEADLFKHSNLLDQTSSRVRVPLPSQRREYMRRLSDNGGPCAHNIGKSVDSRTPSKDSGGSSKLDEYPSEDATPRSIQPSLCSSEAPFSDAIFSPGRSSMCPIGENDLVAASHGLDHRRTGNGCAALWGYVICMMDSLPRVCGVVPSKPSRVWLSLAYQWTVLAFCVGCSVNCIRRFVEPNLSGVPVLQTSLPVDTLAAFGSLLGLLASGIIRRSRSFVMCTQLITSYARSQHLSQHWEKHFFWNVCCSCALWIAAVGLRSAFCDECDVQSTLDVLGFALCAGVLLGISVYLLQACTCLTLMVDRFCCNVVMNADFAAALKEWKLIQALCRAVSRTVQFSFMTSQCTAVAAALLIIAAWGTGHFTKAILPLIFVFSALLHASALAARITDKCARASILVNSSAGGTNFDVDRMYLVQYIERSMTGFYVFEIRIASETILKSFYVACALAFAVATRSV